MANLQQGRATPYLDNEAFQKLLKSSVSILEKDATNRQEYYLERGGIYLEKDIFSIF